MTNARRLLICGAFCVFLSFPNAINSLAFEDVEQGGLRVRRQATDSTTTVDSSTSTTVDASSSTSASTTASDASSTSTTVSTTDASSTTTNTASPSGSSSTDSTSTTVAGATVSTSPASSTASASATSTTGASGSSTSSSQTTATGSTTTSNIILAKNPTAVLCSALDSKPLERCCEQSSKLEFFTPKQKLACNGGQKANNPQLFSQTHQYVLHRKHNARSNFINYAAESNSRALGHPACFFECLYNDAAVLEKNNSVNVLDLANYLSKNLTEEWVQIIADAVDNCTASFEGLPVKRAKKYNSAGRLVRECSLEPYLVHQCVLRTILIKCPAKAATSTPFCLNTREKFRLCDPMVTSTNTMRIRPKKNFYRVVRERNQFRVVANNVLQPILG
ncbi:uncharacterized protein DDB_G0271670-like [Neocloeon triangulifer]|uniref:uncharacterized protein DDB_G0271670-like n=1 Tax=Neocloeon triangulifer TaxID=2078957 RepID=UPI00286EEF9D|nr:uncharacterized protein DDB_G0271670-like [Neocloeon triangulifer]